MFKRQEKRQTKVRSRFARTERDWLRQPALYTWMADVLDGRSTVESEVAPPRI